MTSVGRKRCSFWREVKKPRPNARKRFLKDWAEGGAPPGLLRPAGISSFLTVQEETNSTVVADLIRIRIGLLGARVVGNTDSTMPQVASR